MRIALHGATGRMGKALVRLIAAESDLELVGAACAPNDALLGHDVGQLAGVGALGVHATADVPAALLGADMVIDFSVASALPPLLNAATRAKIALVSGTTGLDASDVAALEQAARLIPILWAPNTSVGVQVLAEIVEQAVRRLGAGYDVEIVEVHHRHKIDAPSGTAKRLAEAVQEARPELHPLHGRHGVVGARSADEMAVLAVRGGDVIGDHTVHLLGTGERLELTHRATSRDLFATGVLRAVRYLAGKPAGRLYRIADLLG